MSTELISVAKRFITEFHSEPLLVRAPGRINLIGEHTDYNHGFALPAAIAHSIFFAIGKSENADHCTLVSIDFSESYTFKLSEIDWMPGNPWQNYVLGVVTEIQKSGKKVAGFNLVFGGNIPRGAGMSSSAALECGTCFALNELFGLQLEKLEMIKMSQLAEHNYVGVKCGIMDQLSSMMGKRGSALLLDCQTNDFDYVPVSLGEYSILLCNSNVEHTLVNSEYNVRRSQCEEGVSILQSRYSEIQSLREVTKAQLENVRELMDDTIYRRCKYVIDENTRVRDFVDALKQKEFSRIGNLLKDAQRGMRFEYEITCPEIDFMADFANNKTGVLGSRMMGGGFGGCTLNLIKKYEISQFVDNLNESYYHQFGIEVSPITIGIEEGVRLVNSIK